MFRGLVIAAALAAASPVVVHAQAKSVGAADADAALRKDFRASMDAEGGAAMSVVRELFPEEYRAYEDDMLAHIKAGAQPTEVAGLGRAFITGLVEKNKVSLLHAPAPKVASVFAVQSRVLKTLQAEDATACRQFGETGQVALERLSGLSSVAIRGMVDVTAEILKAIRAGRATPVAHGPFTSEDAEWMAGRFLQTGGSTAWLEAAGNGDVSGLSDRQRCDNVVIYNDTLAAATPAMQARYFLMASGGEGQ